MKDGLVLSDVVAFSRLGAKGRHAQNAERDFQGKILRIQGTLLEVRSPLGMVRTVM